jgi:D-glycero-alpha-D-manno-heptose-7-phosphate kinase
MGFVAARAPFRISFFGGGTDYPQWYKSEGGAVISTSIDKYCYINCRYLPPFFPQKHRIVWSHIENVQSIAEILHPAVREALRMLSFTDDLGIELHHHSDLPARSGMGSSSSFANATILALKALRGDVISKQELFRLTLELEQNRLKENVGSQDQVATAIGGLNVIKFHESGSIEVVPVNAAPPRIRQLEDKLMLFYTGTSRLASEMAGQVIAGLAAHKDDLQVMRRMVDLAREMIEGNGSFDAFGEMLDETWHRKRNLSAGISNESIDGIYSKARAAGAVGGKLLGAGSAGFMLFYVPSERQAAVRDALNFLLHVPFRFETEGATIVQPTALGAVGI